MVPWGDLLGGSPKGILMYLIPKGDLVTSWPLPGLSFPFWGALASIGPLVIQGGPIGPAWDLGPNRDLDPGSGSL